MYLTSILRPPDFCTTEKVSFYVTGSCELPSLYISTSNAIVKPG